MFRKIHSIVPLWYRHYGVLVITTSFKPLYFFMQLMIYSVIYNSCSHCRDLVFPLHKFRALRKWCKVILPQHFSILISSNLFKMKTQKIWQSSLRLSLPPFFPPYLPLSLPSYFWHFYLLLVLLLIFLLLLMLLHLFFFFLICPLSPASDKFLEGLSSLEYLREQLLR